MKNNIDKNEETKEPINLQDDISHKMKINIFQKHKFWKCVKNGNKKQIIQDFSLQNNFQEWDSNHINIATEDVNFLKYKMGRYLFNNRNHKLTIPQLWQRYWRRILMIIVSAIIFNFGIQFFLLRADTIPSGLTGIPTLLTILLPILKPYFSLIYFGVNLPLFILYWRKIKKSFLYLTLFFMISQILVNLVFTIPEVHDFFMSKINFVPDGFKDSFTVGERVISQKEAWYQEGQTWPILLYGTIGSFFIGIGIAISWKAGGSTGGTDIVAYYFSTKSKKSIGGVLTIISFVTASIFLIIYGALSPNLKHYVVSPEEITLNPNGTIDLVKFNELLKQDTKVQTQQIYFGMRELSTFTYIITTNLTVNLLYPKYKKTSLVIVSSDPKQIMAYFKLINYWHSYRITRFKSGYTGEYSYKIETVILYLEAKSLIHDLKLIDPNIWISINVIDGIVGKFNTQYVEQ
ncbi:YitT family protein [Mycoplasmopsis gallinacea]|uniref:Uncharacterized BCR, YitT family COG1284 n=1 Tax=Mycoplasmopsis gallinacea TaxID=29556 RepID=A0A449A2M7_9BACT|nr:YitT family protein [Mycoplasmopsis gallinacea]VEU58487.1 Uncharacterized BCR, YitT family COG1284 [Mycoplasmopsis gallinacea]